MSRTNVRYVNPPTLSTPTGYSHVVEVQSGSTIYIAGKVAVDKSGNVVGKNDFAAQTTQVFENLKLTLTAAAATLDNLVKVTSFVTNMLNLLTLRTHRANTSCKNTMTR